MKKQIKKILGLFLLAVVLPTLALAHQPRITESRLTEVPDPEISKAYYGKLSGEPDVYTIDAKAPFDLYVNVLVPDIADQKKDVSAVVIKDGNIEKPLAVLNGISFEWKKFYEPFGADTYWMGPEYKARAEAGKYEIRVWSSNNDSKYSLAIGEIEAFDQKEGLNALTLIPQLKKDFWGESPISFIVSPFGWGLIVVMYLLAFVFGLIYRAVFINISMILIKMRLIKINPESTKIEAKPKKNIGKKDRLFRFAIGLVLLLWAILTNWSPILIFLSGFAIFEAIFSWCAFYSAIDKNTCPVE